MLRRALVVAELSLALVLLVSCGLMLQAFWRLQAVDAGFDASNRLTMRVALACASVLGRCGDELRCREWRRRVARLPGVISSTVMGGLPPQRPGNFNDTMIENFVRREGGPVQNVDYWQFVGNRFFETLGVRLVEGRYLDERDGRDAPPAVVVNETMARTFWPGAERSGAARPPSGAGAAEPPWRTIVGVVADIKNGGTDVADGHGTVRARGVKSVPLATRRW